MDIQLTNGPSSEMRLTNHQRSYFGRQNISCPFFKRNMVIHLLSEQPSTEDWNSVIHFFTSTKQMATKINSKKFKCSEDRFGLKAAKRWSVSWAEVWTRERGRGLCRRRSVFGLGLRSTPSGCRRRCRRSPCPQTGSRWSGLCGWRKRTCTSNNN